MYLKISHIISNLAFSCSIIVMEIFYYNLLFSLLNLFIYRWFISDYLLEECPNP